MRFGAAEPDHALTESLEAYLIHPTVEARGSLLTSLEQYPNLALMRENPNPIESLASCHNGAVLVSSDDTGLRLFLGRCAQACSRNESNLEQKNE